MVAGGTEHDNESAGDTDALIALYENFDEDGRLERGLGRVEFERTIEIVSRHLPPPSARVGDIGGGPGRYSVWLADLGYEVEHRDLVPAHVEQLRTRHCRPGRVLNSALSDARDLDLADATVDAVLLLGPLYHLQRRDDRVQAMREAARVARPGAPLFIAAISRWAPRLHGEVVRRLYQPFPDIVEQVAEVESTGLLPPLFPGSFFGYCHRPEELAEEIRTAGLDLVDLVSVEGIAFALDDLELRLNDPTNHQVVLDAARAVERVPDLLGLGPHLLATARRPK